MSGQPPVGQVLWMDLTVPDAETIRDFYAEVVGLVAAPVEMDGYQDFMMTAPGPQPADAAGGAVGICHARGSNADLPPQWLIYFCVADLDASLAAVDRLGGRRIGAIRTYGTDRFCAIEDPAGAACALFQKA